MSYKLFIDKHYLYLQLVKDQLAIHFSHLDDPSMNFEFRVDQKYRVFEIRDGKPDALVADSKDCQISILIETLLGDELITTLPRPSKGNLFLTRLLLNLIKDLLNTKKIEWLTENSLLFTADEIVGKKKVWKRNDREDPVKFFVN